MVGAVRGEVRKLGRRRNDEGGTMLRYEVLNRAHTLSVVRNPTGPRADAIYLDVSKTWSGIGDWESSVSG